MLSILVAATVAAAQSALPLTQDSVAVRKFLTQVRREEARFIAAWRQEWRSWRDLRSTDPRYFSIHCHFDEPLLEREKHHLIRTPLSRKSMCPIWFQEQGTRGDEAQAIDNGIPPRSREKIRERRARVIALLDSAAHLAPADLWVLGQRVRLNVDQGNIERALQIATTECDIEGATCPLFEGYVLASGGHHRAAEATFEFALTRMTGPERCAFLDIAPFVPWSMRDRYDRQTCAERGDANERFWWLADPLFAEPGNERLSVHLYRWAMIAVRAALASEHFDWRPRFGGHAAAEMLLRYGWPNVSYYSRQEDDNHNGWLGWRDSAANSSREYFLPRYHTTPPYESVLDPARLTASDFANVAPLWDEKTMRPNLEWWPIEHVTREGPLFALDHQYAAFRRERGPFVAVATDPRVARIDSADRLGYDAWLTAMRGPRDMPRQARAAPTRRKGGGILLTLEPTPGWQVMSAELLRDNDRTAPAARTRFPVTVPPGLDSLAPGAVAFSDPTLFAILLNDSLPGSADDALERMFPTTTLHDPQRLGVYFEIYGLPADALTDLTLAIVALDQPGLLRRLGARFGIAESGGGAIVVRWQGNHPGTAASVLRLGDAVVHTRSIVLNVGLLRPGRYALEIGMERGAAQEIMSRREFAITR